MRIYLNDRLAPSSEAVVSVFDHGFLYGDGIFETMRVYDGVVFMLEEHLRRLQRSASLTGLALPGDFPSIKLAIFETLEANSLKNAYLRITLSRGTGPIGLDPALCKKPTFVIIADKFSEYPKAFSTTGVKTVIAQTRKIPPEALDPRIKSLNYLNNILAKVEAKRAEAFEAFMLNMQGKLAEGTVCNVFFYKDGVLCTPSLDCGILDGITRGIVLDLAVREGLTVKEGEFMPEDIYGAAEVFITNTTAEIMPVSRLEDTPYAVGDISRLLRKAYKKEVRAYVSNVKAGGPSVWGYND